MTLHFTVTENEYLDFAEFHMNGSATVRHTLLLLQLFVAALLLLVLFVMRPDPLWPSLVFCAVLSGLWFFYLPGAMRRSLRKRVGKLLREGEGNDLIGEITLVLEEDGLREITSRRETLHPYISLLNMVCHGNCIYLYFKENIAIPLPASTFPDAESRQAFLDTLQAKKTV